MKEEAYYRGVLRTHTGQWPSRVHHDWGSDWAGGGLRDQSHRKDRGRGTRSAPGQEADYEAIREASH